MIDKKIKIKTDECLNCINKPCSKKGCPLENDIPNFIRLVKEEKIEEAYKILSETTVLSSICGRVCPHKKQCEGSCVKGIKSNPVNIGDIEAYIGDTAIKENFKISTKREENVENKCQTIKEKQVAIIGGGPAGLTCAAFLAMNNIKVTIYEKYNYLGGLLIHGIPNFRLDKEIVNQTINKILDLGIKVKYNSELNKNIFLEELESKYDAIFLSFGANISSKTGIEGEDILGVYGGNELLEFNNHPKYEDKIVLVNGGGNVAIDVARTVKRLGAKEVKIVYRRSKKEMPAEESEVEIAEKEGIKILYQNNILKIFQDEKGKVKQAELIKTELVKKEGEERLSPVNIPNSNYYEKADYIIMAIGSEPEAFVKKLGLELNKWGNIKINEKGQTSNQKIYAGGDLAGCKGTIAWAAKSGRDAAKNIIEYLKENEA